MEQNIKKQLLESIGKVYEQSRSSNLDTVFFQKVEAELKYLSEYFGVTPNQAFIASIVFALNYKGDTVDLKDLIEYFECNPMRLLEFSDDFVTLYSINILIKEKSTHRLKLTLSNDQFVVNEIVTEAVMSGNPMPTIEKEKTKDVIEFLENVYKLGGQRSDEEISTNELCRKTRLLIQSNLHFPLVKKIHDFQFEIIDTYLFFNLIWRTINGNKSIDLERTIRDIFDTSSIKIMYIQKILSKENTLIAQNHIELIEADFFDDSHIKLSDLSIQLLQEYGIKLFSNKKTRDDIILPSSIHSKTLYFNDSEQKQLEMLKTILHDEAFKNTQRRLTDKGLPKGITALLHGAPGTGKTETVLQVAKECNRAIMKVDISQSKSMWFGESEKIIKKIFTEYKEYAKDCEQMPILLFNEADAIISKRNDTNASNVSKTENAIQNIILEELENFEGIFFATTNLAKNLDTAFERRFLFKIEFHKPEPRVKANIWQSKLPTLTDSECQTLSSHFDFSGGQIDNIIRKNEIHEIIHGTVVDFNSIIEFCKAESLTLKGGARVGFGN